MRPIQFKATPAAIVSPLAFLLQLATNYCSIFVTGNRLFPSTLFDLGRRYATRMWPDIFAFPIIWGAIYLFQALYVARHFFTSAGNVRKDVSVLFPITCALNIAWVFCFVHEKITASLAVFAALWLVLATIWVRLNITTPPDRSFWNYWTLIAPFSLYLGWSTFDLQLNIASFVQMYRGSPFRVIDIIACTAAATVVGWLALAIVCDVMLCAGISYGFAAVLYRAQGAHDNELLFVMGLAISSVVSAAIVRLMTNWLKKEMRWPKYEAPSSFPLDPRIIEA